MLNWLVETVELNQLLGELNAAGLRTDSENGKW